MIYEDCSPNEAADILREKGARRITVLFEAVNFLFTDYPLSRNMSNTLIADTSDGKPVFMKGFNCGYLGRGPEKTNALLLLLGADEDKASCLAYKTNGFVYDLEQKEEVKAGFPFAMSHKQGRDKAFLKDAKILFLRKQMAVDFRNRTLFIFEPAGGAYFSLIQILNEIKAHEVRYYIGTEGYFFREKDSPYIPSEEYHNKEYLFGPYIEIVGEPFSVSCYLGNKCPASVINSIAIFLRGIPVFSEIDAPGQCVTLSETGERISLAKSILGKHKEIRGSFFLEKEAGGVL